MTSDYNTMTITLLHNEHVIGASHACNTSTTMQSSMDAEAHAQHVTLCIHYIRATQHNTDLTDVCKFLLPNSRNVTHLCQ